MATYILRRLLLMVPTLLGITLVVFTVMASSPGGISAQSLVEGQNLDPEAKKEIEAYYNRIYGLDDPAPIQYLRWLNNVSPFGFQFDDNNDISGFSFSKGSNLGQSFRYGRPVKELLKERIPITLLLNTVSIPIIYILAISIGVHAATERGGAFDVGSGIVMLTLWSVPTMLTGVLLIGFFANIQYWQWFPTAGLSSSESTEMPFMPHWQSWTDILLLFFILSGTTALAIWLNRMKIRRFRMGILSLFGAGLGCLMISSLSGSSGITSYILFAAFGAAVLSLVAAMDFPALRTAIVGTIGLVSGLVITFRIGGESFVHGFLLDRLWHLALPILCLSYGGFAALSKLTRTAVLENLQADYARTARAKGLPENQVLWRHVFRNSLLPLITVASSLLPGLLAGSIIVESIFSIEGMGKLAVEAVQTRDRELVLSITLISGILTLLGYLIADLFYAIADPRISYE
ncbi:MAG: ABC transporter permease [Methylococcales bacterium]